MKKEKLHEETLRLLVFVIGIFSICILLLTFKINVNAQSPSGDLPYVIPSYRDYNSYIPDSALESAISYYYANVPSSVTINSFIAYTYDYPNVNGVSYRIYFVTNPSIIEGVSPSIDYFQNSVRVNSNDYSICYVNVRQSDFVATGFSYNVGSWTYMLGNESLVTQSNGLTTRKGYPILMSGVNNLYSYPIPDGSGDSVLVFTNNVPFTPDVFETGHAQEPSFDSDTIIDSSLHPNVKPTFPTYNTYNITNYSSPSIDTSTVETLLESLIDVVIYNTTYVVSNIVGSIQNLWNNLGSFLEYLGDLLSYLFNRVINSIKQTADNLYQNFKDLFEPVLNSFANFINMVNVLYGLGLKDGSFDIPTLFGSLFLPNESDLDLLISTYFNEFEVFELATTSVTSLFDNIFDLLNDDPVYSFHMPSFTFHGISFPSYEISFDWYLPYKATGDLFISAFLIVGYLYWLWVRLSGIFHGVSPDPVPISSGEHQITGDFWTPKTF